MFNQFYERFQNPEELREQKIQVNVHRWSKVVCALYELHHSFDGNLLNRAFSKIRRRITDIALVLARFEGSWPYVVMFASKSCKVVDLVRAMVWIWSQSKPSDFQFFWSEEHQISWLIRSHLLLYRVDFMEMPLKHAFAELSHLAQELIQGIYFNFELQDVAKHIHRNSKQIREAIRHCGKKAKVVTAKECVFRPIRTQRASEEDDAEGSGDISGAAQRAAMVTSTLTCAGPKCATTNAAMQHFLPEDADGDKARVVATVCGSAVGVVSWASTPAMIALSATATAGVATVAAPAAVIAAGWILWDWGPALSTAIGGGVAYGTIKAWRKSVEGD
eukprot:gnl/MRDRNA2_/MRDRNA2_71778_c0_seq1.p1 gnl/MRDRNA2_/MRDRNA2_71778_c0~~gnl/MRDRNA2_/MRDRNA2_71778_c0_seq1.p1  ORF type:complete len:333 (-),score=57.01 gnl/MRDRNA2_/MRDRNA2_71778_c0_seq1:283-1281(-)